MPRRGGGGRGDNNVLIKLHVPKKISKGLKRQISELHSEISIEPDDYEDFVRGEADGRRRSH